jgi:hypothetical protein
MKFPRRQFLHLAAGAAALTGVSRIARAQVYPSRPITIVVPFPAGGSTDVIGRILAEKMRASLGQTIIIENVGAAGGSIGVGRVARQRRTATPWISANGTLMSRTVPPICCPTIPSDRKAADSRCDGSSASHRRARDSDRGRGGTTRHNLAAVDWPVRSGRDAERDRRADRTGERAPPLLSGSTSRC